MFGLELFATPEGMVDFIIGMFNGTQLVQNETDMEICANTLSIDIVAGA